jgi:CRP-like cAMP-binding protein
VTIKDIGKVAELHEGDYFGDRALVADDKRTATCTAIGNDCRVLTLDREDFVALLGSVEDLVQHGTNEEVEVETTEDRVALDVTLEHLDVQRTLGHGAFGKVQLVMDRRNGTSYALKYQSKAMIVENSLCDHVLREREMLMKLDHP